MTDLSLLFQVMAMVCGTAVIAWLAVGLPMRIAPRASIRFAIANLLFLTSILLTLQRTAQSHFWFWPAADLVGLLAILILRRGTRSLFKQPVTWLYDSIGFALLVAIYLSQPFDGRAATIYGITYSLVMALVTALICRDVFLATHSEFNTKVAIAVTWPFGVIALAMLSRGALIALHQQSVSDVASPMAVDNRYSMLAYAFLVLILNISLIGCVLSRLIAKLRTYSERDYLTGLLNRRAFEHRLGMERQRSERTGNVYSLILFDIDHFKRINDQHGHSCGDLALKHIAKQVGGALRQFDSFARFGGEEFIILLPETSITTTQQVAERLRAMLAETPLMLDGRTMVVQASFGCVASTAGDKPSLLRMADNALYRAKTEGRNRVVLASVEEGAG